MFERDCEGFLPPGFFESCEQKIVFFEDVVLFSYFCRLKTVFVDCWCVSGHKKTSDCKQFLMDFRELPGNSIGASGRPWELLEAICEFLEISGSFLRAPGKLEAFWEPLVTFWDLLETVWEVPGSGREPVGIPGSSWEPLGTSWEIL